MNTRVRQALDAFNADNTRSERAEVALSTLISCFGDSYVDVVRYSPIDVDERYDSSLNRLVQQDASVEDILNYLKRYQPFWAVLIHFPHEVITNEYGSRVDIYDFFVKVAIRHNGTFYGIGAIKTTYTEDQFYSGYVHSHCPSMSRNMSGIKEWKGMCFGSGPINNTMSLLRNSNFDERLWIGFAAELRQWVRTESTDGGPYFRMNSISNKYEEVTHAVPLKPVPLVKQWLLPLVKSYIRADRLKVGFTGGKYCLGTTFTEWLTDFSEYAKAWGSKNGIAIQFVNTLIINNKICKIKHSSDVVNEYQSLIGTVILRFKGQDMKLKIIHGNKVEHLNLIDYRLGLYIVKTLLDTINYNYGRTNTANTAVPVQWK